MTLAKRYQPEENEPKLQEYWQAEKTYHFSPKKSGSVYAVDTPPPTVSGHLHLGHVYSYSHADFMARYFRMQGRNVFYPMGFDDNGLPTERLVEKRLGIKATQVGRETFIQKCLEISEEAEKDYQALWQRLGLSIDWRYTYRTIDEQSRRTSQVSFIDLYRKGLAYREQAPTLWCPECQTAIAQAELADLERQSEFVTLPFSTEDGHTLHIATTRPELLAACVAVFVHPDDLRYQAFLGKNVHVPLYNQLVPVLADPTADPEKGTGAVMCCTFGDQTDMAWWFTYKLPLVEAIDRQGRLTDISGPLSGLPIPAARKRVKEILEEEGLILSRQPTSQSIRVHERCDTPVEYIITRQWFVRILENREQFLAAGEQVRWHPDHMQARYRAWVENLNWDWCISRQRYFGVTFPLWYCKKCGNIQLAEEDQLPIDPTVTSPQDTCACGCSEFEPETDVMDTWATSSLSPQIIGRWLSDPELYDRVFPFTLRPQAHEIIRTWAFYTIVKSQYHFNKLPWSDVLISGWGLAGEGMGKISKSRGGGPMPPLEMIQKYSADAVRYWAASTSPGKDSVISEEKIQAGGRLVTKLWNVARFSETFLSREITNPDINQFTPADRWILAAARNLVRRATAAFENYEYAIAKSEIETFFWKDLADNYLEMAKQRLYAADSPTHSAACSTLYTVLLTLIKLFAPFMPYVTESIYQELFAEKEGAPSIHNAAWPAADPVAQTEDQEEEARGEFLVLIATAARRYKSEQNLSLGSELSRLQLAGVPDELKPYLLNAIPDLSSITRSQSIEVSDTIDPLLNIVETGDPRLVIAVKPLNGF